MDYIIKYSETKDLSERFITKFDPELLRKSKIYKLLR